MKLFKVSEKHETNEKSQDPLSIRPIILPIVFCLVCGVLLIVLRTLALRITAYVLSGVMIACAAWFIITYIRSTPVQRITQTHLASGLCLLVSGCLLAFNPDYLQDFLPFIWGLALLFGGFLKIQYAFNERSVKVEKWWIMLILAAFSIAVGVISLLNPAFLGEDKELIIGILLIVEAVIDVTVFFLLRHALKKINESAPAPAAYAAPVPADIPPDIPPDTPPADQPDEVHEAPKIPGSES